MSTHIDDCIPRRPQEMSEESGALVKMGQEEIGKSDFSPVWDESAQNHVINDSEAAVGLCPETYPGLRVLASIPAQQSSLSVRVLNSYHSMYLLEDRGILSTFNADTMGALYNMSASFIDTFADIDKVVNAGVMAAAIQKRSFEELVLTTTKEEILDWNPATSIPEMKVLESGEKIKLLEAYEELRTLSVAKSETAIERLQGASLLLASSRLASGSVFYKFYLRCRKICHNLQYLYPHKIGRGYADFVLTAFRQAGAVEFKSDVEASFSFMMSTGWPERRREYTQRQAAAPAPAVQFSKLPPAAAPAKASDSASVSTLKAPVSVKPAVSAPAPEATVALTLQYIEPKLSSVSVDKPVPAPRPTKVAAVNPAPECTVESPRNFAFSNGVEPQEPSNVPLDMEGELNGTDADFGSDSRCSYRKETREELFRQIVIESSAAVTAGAYSETTPSSTRISSRIVARKKKKEEGAGDNGI